MGDNWISITQTPDSTNLVIYPNANSSPLEMLASSGASYECIDESYASPNDSDYIYWDGLSVVSSWFTMADHTTETGTINYIRAIARAKSQLHNQSSSGSYEIVLSDGTTKGFSGNKAPLTTTYSKYYMTASSRPSSGNWTWGDVDNIQLGIKANSPTLTQATHSEILRPIGDISTEFNAHGETNNYECVDDVIADDDTTLIRFTSDFNSATDRYTLSDTSSATASTNGITSVVVYHRFIAYEDNSWEKVGLYINGTEYWGTARDSDNWANASDTWTVNPDTSAAWTWDDIEAMDLIVKCGIGSDGLCYVTQIYVVVNYVEDANPDIRTSQLYAVVNYTPPASEVSLSMPDSINVSHSRDISRFTFADGDYEIEDMGRSGKSMTISGIEYDSTVSDMLHLKDMCHYGNIVTLGNLPDDNLNTNYLIRSFSWNDISYCDATQDRIYRWNIELEEA